MVEPTQDGRSHDSAKLRRFAFPAKRRVAIKSLMRAKTVVVREEFLQGASQVILTEDNQVVQAFPPNGTHKPAVLFTS